MLRSGLLGGAAIMLVSAATAGSAGAKEQFTTFDPSGSIYTVVASINASGAVAGYYEDSGGVTHGFLRTADGTITVFDPKGSTSTGVGSINDSGDIAGWYRDRSGTYRNFVRAGDGTIAKFDATSGYEPAAVGLNAKGKVAGWYETGNYQMAGFIGMPEGKIRQLTVEGVAINTKGVVTGVDGSQGFVRTPSGKIATFAGPGNPNTTTPTSIDDSGVVAGYDQTICGNAHGFRGARAARRRPSILRSWSTPSSRHQCEGRLTGRDYYCGDHGFVGSPD